MDDSARTCPDGPPSYSDQQNLSLQSGRAVAGLDCTNGTSTSGVPLLARRQGLSAWFNLLPDPVLGQSPEIVSMGPDARGCMSHMPNRHRLRLFPRQRDAKGRNFSPNPVFRTESSPST
ncbi:hypothetical protein GGI42DRAFT_231925 [Trichoderma sp. SZMC 28013]